MGVTMSCSTVPVSLSRPIPREASEVGMTTRIGPGTVGDDHDRSPPPGGDLVAEAPGDDESHGCVAVVEVAIDLVHSLDAGLDREVAGVDEVVEEAAAGPPGVRTAENR